MIRAIWKLRMVQSAWLPPGHVHVSDRYLQTPSGQLCGQPVLFAAFCRSEHRGVEGQLGTLDSYLNCFGWLHVL